MLEAAWRYQDKIPREDGPIHLTTQPYTINKPCIVFLIFLIQL